MPSARADARHQRSTPGRPRRGPGVVLSVGLAVLACEAPAAEAVIQLDTGEVRLERGAVVHEVRLAGAGALDSIAPATVNARPGDAVRFIAPDRRTHAPAFIADSLGPDARAYLERSGQLRGPPLVNDGAEWVVILRDAPAGRYPFLCRTHHATGVVVVRSD